MKSEKRKTERKHTYVKPKVIATYQKKELEENIKADAVLSFTKLPENFWLNSSYTIKTHKRGINQYCAAYFLDLVKNPWICHSERGYACSDDRKGLKKLWF